jgi:hypothetical protein
LQSKSLDNPQQDPLSKKNTLSFHLQVQHNSNDFTKNLIDYSKIYIEERHGKTYSILELIAIKFCSLEAEQCNNLYSQRSPDLLSNINRVVSAIIHNLTDNAVKTHIMGL